MQDTLQNMITGMGTARDKTTGTRFVFTEMGKDQVEQAFRSDWISRKIIQIPADDATREWRNWQSDQKDIEQLETLEKDLNVKGKVKQAMWKARLYGGAAILIGVDQTGDLSSELDPTKIKKDGLKFLHVVSRWELSAQENDWDIESPYYGTPKSYTRANANTHASRQDASWYECAPLAHCPLYRQRASRPDNQSRMGRLLSADCA
jgi:phage-related protein (TIGR01555 family)